MKAQISNPGNPVFYDCTMLAVLVFSYLNYDWLEACLNHLGRTCLLTSYQYLKMKKRISKMEALFYLSKMKYSLLSYFFNWQDSI